MSSIKELLSKNEHSKLFKVAKIEFKDNEKIYNHFFVFEQEYLRLEDNRINATITFDKHSTEINKLNRRILNVIEGINKSKENNQITHPPTASEATKLFFNSNEKGIEYGLKLQEDTNYLNQMIRDSAEAFTFDDANEEAINMTCASLRKYTARKKVMQKSLITMFNNQEKEFDQLIRKLRLITHSFDNLNPSYTPEELRGTRLIIEFLKIYINTHKKNELTVKSLEIQRKQSKNHTLLTFDNNIKKFKNEKIIKSLIDAKSIMIDYFDTAKKYNPLNVTDINVVKEIKAELMLTLKEIEKRIET